MPISEQHVSPGRYIRCISSYGCGTVDGRNPAPHDIHKALQIMVDSPYQLVQDFFHQQYGSYHVSLVTVSGHPAGELQKHAGATPLRAYGLPSGFSGDDDGLRIVEVRSFS